METHMALPGLDRLIEVCHKHGLPLELSPPLGPVPKAGDTFRGQAFDPMLAAVYQRLSGAMLDDFSLCTSDRSRYGLFDLNEPNPNDGEPFRSCIIFGRVPQLAYYYGTVPALVDDRGLQPVVFIDGHAIQFAVPIASDVDRFFDTYSHYLEIMAVDSDYVQSGVPGITFPWDVPEIVARDKSLVEAIRTGRFDFLTNDYKGARKWIQELTDARVR